MNQTVLIENGRPRAEIVLPRECDRVLRFASRELRRYLKRIGGAQLPLRESQSSGGKLKLVLRRAALSSTPDSYSIQACGDQVTLTGRNSRSVLYAVYDLLETLGCRFIEPGIEHVPKLKTVALPQINRTETAAFALRNIFRNILVPQKKPDFRFLDPELFVPQIDWMAKRRLNHHVFYIDYYRYDLWEKYKRPVLDALLDRGFDLEVTHHSLHYFCPPDENHDFGDWGDETYQRRHPDWYLPSYECGLRGRWQTRVELPAVQKVVVRRVLEYARRNPELKIIGLWPDDIPMNNPSRGLNPSDGYLTFWNRVADALRTERPDTLLGIIAYFELIKAPRKVGPAPNQNCWWCPLERNYNYPLRDPRSGAFLKHLKPWVNQLAPHRLCVFDYYGWSVPFIPYRFIMQDDLRVYRNAGVGGLYAWSGFTHNLMGEDNRWALDFYCLAHLLWNPECDVRSREEQWARGVFGQAASRVLDFFEFMRIAHKAETKRGLAGYILHEFAGNNRWISPDTLRRAQDILASARRKAGRDERSRQRIDQLEILAAHGSTQQIRR